jgi:hypothetical protein
MDKIREIVQKLSDSIVDNELDMALEAVDKYCDLVALSAIEITTGLKFGSKQSKVYLRKAKNKTISKYIENGTKKESKS